MRGQPIMIASLMAFHTANAVDWGQMDQYKSQLQSPPQLSGNMVWLSGKTGEGFDVVLSQDTSAKVQGVLEGCGKADDQCFQDVLDILQSADFDLDDNLERRSFGALLSKTVKGAWDIFSDIAIMLYVNWEIKANKMDNSAFYLPQAKAEEAANSASATSVLHSAGGSVIITITPTPDPTTLTGTAAPAVTTATSDINGHKQGDLLATLDEDLASRINEVAQRMKDCDDGRKFDTEHGSRKRAGTATYGQALCAAEGIIGMAGKGAPFADLTMLSHDKMGIELANNAVKAKEALWVLMDFITAYGPMLAIPQELVEQLGTYVLALVIDAIVIDNVSIGPTNFISPDLAVTYDAMKPKPSPTSSSATSSSSGCPDPTKIPLLCGSNEGGDCDAQLPDPSASGNQSAVCKNSQYQGCVCNLPVMWFDDIMGADEYAAMQSALNLFQELEDQPKNRTANIACHNDQLSAPRSDKDANGATSVEKAIETWCGDNDGKDVGSSGFYQRWGVTDQGVPGRSSFWLRAAQTCQTTDKFNREECQKALTDGMDQCDKGPQTNGFAASVACLDYSIDTSGITYDDEPPWAEMDEDRMFPPPEYAEKKGGGGGYAPICHQGNGERPLTDSDLNRAIDAFCQDGKEIQGFGNLWANMFDYPPANQPQFYNNDGYKMYVTMGAETINNGGPQPYEDMRWCKGYDWKMGKDDCTYALRKLYNTCTKDRSKNLNGGEYTYRCVRYKSWPINTR